MSSLRAIYTKGPRTIDLKETFHALDLPHTGATTPAVFGETPQAADLRQKYPWVEDARWFRTNPRLFKAHEERDVEFYADFHPLKVVTIEHLGSQDVVHLNATHHTAWIRTISEDDRLLFLVSTGAAGYGPLKTILTRILEPTRTRGVLKFFEFHSEELKWLSDQEATSPQDVFTELWGKGDGENDVMLDGPGIIASDIRKLLDKRDLRRLKIGCKNLENKRVQFNGRTGSISCSDAPPADLAPYASTIFLEILRRRAGVTATAARGNGRRVRS